MCLSPVTVQAVRIVVDLGASRMITEVLVLAVA